MSKRRLTGKRAVWFGLLGTPVLLVAAITLVGVTAGSAGPATGAKANAAQAATDIDSHVNAQTAEQIAAYWTPQRMSAAQQYPQGEISTPTPAEGSVQTVPQATGKPGAAIMRADGSVDTQTVPAASTGALTEPFHANVPYTQYQWFGRYLRNVPAGSPNLAISAQAKMFFSQDHDGNGSISNFVCSASSIGPDAVWTAGHCVNNGIMDPNDGANDGWSSNILFCPSYDVDQGGVNPNAGCWASTTPVSFFGWTDGLQNLDFDYDFGAVDSATPSIAPAAGLIGNFTGWLGAAWNWGNQNWVSLGYPQAAPFNGGKIEVCLSSLGYADDGGASVPNSVAIGCDMTGGSSGGPWILGFGRFGGQPGGNAALWINGHNDWRHNAEPNEMASPYYDCRTVTLYNAVNETSIVC
jgi:hypothetical protein